MTDDHGTEGAAWPPLRNFAVTLVHDSAWDDDLPIREQREWAEHAAFMDELVDKGFLLMGGPVGRGDHTLHVVEARDERHVRQEFAEDPWARAGLLAVGTIEPWSLWLDFRSQPGGSGREN